MVHCRLSVLAMVLAAAGCAVQRERSAATAPARMTRHIRVLFVGDSLTYTNDLPGMVARLSAKEAAPVEAEGVTLPGISLAVHWLLGRAAARIREGHFDYVVLQDFSTRPATDAAASEADYEKFGALARANGAVPIVFENWTHAGRGGDLAVMDKTYAEAARLAGGVIAPIGDAWAAAGRAYPQVQLLSDDRHPTVAGTYLAACVIYRVLYGEPCVEGAAGVAEEAAREMRAVAGRDP